eukprot:6286697-Pyramimonas_sp.AAC.1
MLPGDPASRSRVGDRSKQLYGGVLTYRAKLQRAGTSARDALLSEMWRDPPTPSTLRLGMPFYRRSSPK